MNSPSGGGYGSPDTKETDAQTNENYNEFLERGSVFEYRSAQESV